MLATASICASAWDFEANGIYYEITSESEQTCEVCYNPAVYRGNVSIPGTATNNGKAYTVTAIGEEAFYYCTDLTGITLPNTVDTIKTMAFWACSALTEVTIPNSVKVIGSSCFATCDNLKTVNLGNSVEEIGIRAFISCQSLEGISIPSSVSYIGYYAFADCPKFSTITVDEGNQHYKSADNILYDKKMTELILCTRNKPSVTIPSGVEAIGVGAFLECKELASVTLPNTVNRIKSYAFQQCSALEEITLPPSLETIESEAFARSGLKEIYIPANVVDIVEDAFTNCSDLLNINVDPATRYYASADGVLYDKQLTTLYTCPGAKTSVSIPQTVTKISDRAFSGAQIASIELPGSLTEIGEETFMYCSALKEIAIPNLVTKIGSDAFYSCQQLKKVVLGASVEHIAEYAFNGCGALEEVYSYNPQPPTLSFNVWNDWNYATLYVPQGSVTAYQNASGWGSFSKILELDPTAIDNVASNGITANASPDGITVNGVTAGLPVNVYDEGGRLVHSTKATGNSLAIPAPKGHVYIVKVGGKSIKLAL